MRKIGVAVEIPEPWASRLDAHRTDSGDPMAALIPAHLTLLGPTEVDPAPEVAARIEEHLLATAADHRPFQLRLRVRTTPSTTGANPRAASTEDRVGRPTAPPCEPASHGCAKICGMRWVDRLDAGVSRAVDGARKRSAAFDHVWQAITRFVDVDAGRLAAAISYYAFFAAFSLAVFVYALLGRLLGSAQTGVLPAINSYLEESLPWVADTTRQVGQGQVTVVAGAVLLLSGIGWVENLRSSLRAVWLIEQHPGNWLLRRLVNLGMLIGLGALLGLSLAMTGAVDRLLAWLAPDTGLGEGVLRLFGPLFEFVINLVLAAALLTGVPRLRLSPRRLAVPAVMIAAGIQVLNTLGRLFIARTEGQPAYQLVAGAAGLLVYLYLLNQVILLGAALAATSTAGTATDLARGVASGLPGGEPTARIGVDDPQDHVGEPRPPRPEERR